MSLISVEELAAELAGPRPPTLLDVRWPIPGPPDRDGYLAAQVTAAHTVLAVTLTGAPAPALYAGSWSEWSADPSRPVATGPEPG